MTCQNCRYGYSKTNVE